MPLPTNTMMHQDAPLQTMTINVMQEDDAFILMKSTEGSVEEVDHKSNTYYVFDDGDWNRMEMQPRGPSEESHGSGWRLSTDSYSCSRYACHKDWDISDAANADEAVADVDAQAELYLANQGRIYGDYLMSQEVFAAGVWTSDDLDGTTSTVTVGTNFKQWDDSSGDPQADCLEYSQRIAGRIGHEANTFIAGAVTHSRLLRQSVIRTAMQSTVIPTKQAVRDILAAYLGVDNYFVARAFRNTAAENATKTYEYICDSKAAWLGYVSPNSGPQTMSAYKLFAYKQNGAASKGIIVRTFEIPTKTTIRHEIEAHWDVKVIAAEAGCFFDAAVS